MPERGSARVVTDAGFVNLRGNAEDAEFMHRAARVLDQPLPAEPNTISIAGHRVYWLGPDEWLIRCAAGQAAGVVAALEDALAGLHVAVNDVSGGNVAIDLAGAAVRDLLARGSTLDFHPRAFRPGDCAQTGLAKAGVLVGQLTDAPTFELVVRRSFADYVLRWLRHSGSGLGIEFA
ncbi:MAG: sarcosine oxidase subunit gamma family protein [Woeseiaceae bacterium]|nr:sarcosine oxidase subunit gamma family protein [Woeseiaceae bacterium]